MFECKFIHAGRKHLNRFKQGFVDGLSQKLQRIYRTYGIATSFKPHSILRKQLVSPRDLTPADKKSGVVYEIHCTNCPDIYIGHTGRQLGERLKEHKSLAPSCKLSAIAEHFSITGHTIDWKNTKVLDRDDREYPRQVREAIYIKKKKSSLNRDQGLALPSLYNGLLWLTSSRSLGGQ